MTNPVRYQEGHLYVRYGAWYVRYRQRVRRDDGSIKLRQRANRLGSVKDYPSESHIKPLLIAFMSKVNAGMFTPEPGMTVKEFVEKIYFSCLGEKRASTRKGYVEIWENHICDRVGNLMCCRVVLLKSFSSAIAFSILLASTVLKLRS